MIKFLNVPGELLFNPDLTSAHKLLLAYLLNLESSNRYFYGSVDYLAQQFGTTIKAIEQCVTDLIKLDFVSKDATGALRLTVSAADIYNYKKGYPIVPEILTETNNHIQKLASIYKVNSQGR
jgi:hypothetical protein